MATDLSICNAALLLLGDSPIASLAETSKRAVLCSTFYEQARDDVLRMHPWNCLVVRVQLAPTGTAPPFGWDAAFTRPGDWLRTLSVGNEDDGPDDYAFEGGEILANLDVLDLRYIARKDAPDWDSHLVDLMTKRMAADLAYPITKSTSLAQLRAQIFEAAKKSAKAVDGQENPPEDFGDSPFISVRG